MEKLSEDYNRINSYASPLLASPDPQQQARGNQFLAQSTSPPAKFSDLYSQLGLNTNGDILSKAPQYIDNLSGAAPERDKQADYWAAQAQQALNAANVMKQFVSTLDQRNSNIQSIDQGTLLTAKTKNGKGAAEYPNKDESLSLNQASARGKTAPLADPSLDAQGRPRTSGKSAANKSSIALQGSGSVEAAKTGRNPSSLRDRLREKLAGDAAAAKKENGGAGSGDIPAPKSAFDSVFENAGKRNPASADADKAYRSGSGFTMSGADTDAAVRRIVSGLDPDEQSADMEKNIYGNPDVTIFARMSKYLVKAQTDKKVVR